MLKVAVSLRFSKIQVLIKTPNNIKIRMPRLDAKASKQQLMAHFHRNDFCKKIPSSRNMVLIIDWQLITTFSTMQLLLAIYVKYREMKALWSCLKKMT